MSGKGMRPTMGYQPAKFRANYDPIFRKPAKRRRKKGTP